MADPNDGNTLVWYVAYGSNTSEERFLKYFTGDLSGSGVRTKTMKDPRPPEESEPTMMPHRLYFGGTYLAWGGTSGLFLETANKSDARDVTYARQYLISWEQCQWLMRAENVTAGMPDRDEDYPTIALSELKRGSLAGPPSMPYGLWRLHKDGPSRPGHAGPIPRITLSGRNRPDSYRAPSDAYLEVIVRGLREAWPALTDREVLDYFTDFEGLGRPPSNGVADEPTGRARAWAIVSAIVARPPERRKSVAIVGGGIAGLYCALKLAEITSFEITVFEASPRFGGRIETKKMGAFEAEYGPMRFETTIEPFLTQLVEVDLEPEPAQRKEDRLEFVPFPRTSADMTSARTGSSRYQLRHDELRHTRDVLGSEPGDGGEEVMTSTLDLLRLGVLRIFREPFKAYLAENGWNPDEQAKLDLCVDTTAGLPEGRWENGEWQADKGAWGDPVVVPDTIVLSTADPVDQKRIRLLVQRWLDSLDDPGYDALRRNARHQSLKRVGYGGPPQSALEGHLLRDEGFWNAIGEELSPPAISYIRNEGTFYHLFPDNPNAVEWGIFWLRLLKTDANQLKGIKGGTERLVERLTAKLRSHTHVSLRPAQEVLEVAPGTGQLPICLTVSDRRDGGSYVVEADQAILALPLAPLLRLSEHFPTAIREDLTRVFGFALLKCFLVVRRHAWWRKETLPQSGAGGVPTRELHFKRDGASGMVMIYTDVPATQFWKPFVASPVHDHAELDQGEDTFKKALAFHLLINARREAHRDLTALLLDALANSGTRRGSLPDEDPDADSVRGLVKKLRDWIGKPNSQPLLQGWYKRLISAEPAVVTLENFGRILDMLRHPGFDSVAKECDLIRPQVYKALTDIWRENATVAGSDLPSVAVSVVFPRAAGRASSSSKPYFEGEEKPIDQLLEMLTGDIQTWGIRDWSRSPVGAGCHAWSIGARSWETMGRLDAFTPVGRRRNHPPRTVHVCGEAVSDYQGFIEGALRSADRVVRAVLTQERETSGFAIFPSD